MEEARNTYDQLICEFAETSEDNKIEAMNAYFINSQNPIEKEITLNELNNYNKTHSIKYTDIEPKELIIKLKDPIYVVQDNENFLIIDGNHRVNTGYDLFPNKIMNVLIIKAPIYKGMI